AKLISSYGGVPVYIGGDDALFFAPVRYGEKDIYMLIDQIDEAFHKSLTEAGISNKPSLSVGISIAYYKHPLVENLERSRDKLFGKAKNFQFKNGKKNAVACLVQKHSGHQFEI